MQSEIVGSCRLGDLWGQHLCCAVKGLRLRMQGLLQISLGLNRLLCAPALNRCPVPRKQRG